MSDDALGDALFIGVGHRFRSDDGAGPWLAEKLEALGFRAIAHEGDGTGLIDLFAEADRIVIADAAQGGGSPGTTLRFDAATDPLPKGWFRNSTHEFGLAEAVETARQLEMLPKSLVVHGIVGADFGFGSRLSDEVATAAQGLLDALASRRSA